jgi:hypothetical protein
MGFRIPTAINHLKVVPTTRLGRLGKALNPLNPVNAATLLLEEAISGLAGSTLGPEARQRTEYFGFGLLPGIAMNVLDAGAVSANQDQLAKEAQEKYLREQQNARAEQARAAEIEAHRNNPEGQHLAQPRNAPWRRGVPL